jgi:hypothetical protein
MNSLQSFWTFIQRYLVFVQGAAGAALLGFGIYARPSSDAGTILVGLGVALLATFLLAVISLNRDDLLEALFRQGVIEVFPSRAGRTPDSYWDGLLTNVSRHYRVLGVANHAYSSTEAKKRRYRELIRSAIDRGVEVEFIWLSPTCPAAPIRENEEGRGTRKDTVNSIRWFWSLREELEETQRGRLAMKEHEHIPSCGITHADESLTVTHYVPGQDNWDSPGWILTESRYPFFRRLLALFRPDYSKNELVEVYLNTYTEVSGTATRIDADRVAALTARLPEYEGKPSEVDLRTARFPEVGP